MTRNYLNRYGQTLAVNEDMADRNQHGMTGWRKTQGSWVVEIGGRHLLEEAKAHPGL